MVVPAERRALVLPASTTGANTVRTSGRSRRTGTSIRWRERESQDLLWHGPDTYELMVVYFPKTWLLSEGWRKHGTISFYEVPSTRPS